MSTLLKFFSCYVQRNIHVALMVLCLYLTTVVEWNLHFSRTHLGIVVLGSFLSYSFIKDTTQFLKSLAKFYRVLDGGVFFFSGLMFGVLSLLTSLSEILILAITGLLVLFYIFPQTKFKNLRNLTGVKIYVVSLCWVLITAVYPFRTFELSSAQYWYLGQRFLLVILATLPFEIRDLKTDAPQLNTLAQTLGVKKVQYLSILLSFFICVFTLILSMHYGVASYSAMFLLPFYVLSMFQIKRISTPFFVSFWVELIPLFGLIFLYFTT